MIIHTLPLQLKGTAEKTVPANYLESNVRRSLRNQSKDDIQIKEAIVKKPRNTGRRNKSVKGKEKA